MLLEKLPLELAHQIIELVLCDKNPKTFNALLRVSRVLGDETIALHLQPFRKFGSEAARWKQVPLRFRRRMAHATILGEPDPGTKRDITTYMHAVVDYLEKYSKLFDPEGCGSMSREEWLYEIGDILALREADCECGKPAFQHLKCYNLAHVPDTAFHIAILKRHTTLEKAMIGHGRAWDSACPYLKVPNRQPMFTRRNALEWACAYGFEDTVRRLVDAAEKEGRKPTEYIPTAAAIVAVVSGNAKHKNLLDFLLGRIAHVSFGAVLWDPSFQYQNQTITGKEWNRRVLTTLATYKRKLAIVVMRRHFPYLEFPETLRLLPNNFCRETFGEELLQKQRPHCRIHGYSLVYGPQLEWEFHWHWFQCDAGVCHRKDFPVCQKCRRQHAIGPDKDLYDYRGYPLSALS